MAVVVLLGSVGYRRLSGDEKAGDGRRVLQCDAHDLGRIDDALLDHVAVLVVLRIVAERLPARFQHLADDDRAFHAGVVGDLADRSLQRLPDDSDAGLLVRVLALLQ